MRFATFLLVACWYGAAAFPTVGRVNSVVVVMNFYIFGPFLIVSLFAGSPMLLCQSLDIAELSLEFGHPVFEDLPIWGRLDVVR